MSIIKRVRWGLLLMYIISVVFSTAGIFISVWYFIGTVYTLLHLFAPLDWYFFYKLIKWIVKR